MNEHIKRKPVIVLAISLLVLFAAWLGGYMLWRMIDRTIREVRTQEETSLERARRESMMRRVIAVTTQTANARKRLQDFFITSKTETIAFLETVEHLADLAGVSLKLSILPGKKDESLTFRINIDGTYAQIHRFMRMLESLPYYVEIVRAMVARSGEEARMWHGNIDLLLIGYKEE